MNKFAHRLGKVCNKTLAKGWAEGGGMNQFLQSATFAIAIIVIHMSHLFNSAWRYPNRKP